MHWSSTQFKAHHIRMLPLHPAQIFAWRIDTRTTVHGVGIFTRIYKNNFHMIILRSTVIGINSMSKTTVQIARMCATLQENLHLSVHPLTGQRCYSPRELVDLLCGPLAQHTSAYSYFLAHSLPEDRGTCQHNDRHHSYSSCTLQ